MADTIVEFIAFPGLTLSDVELSTLAAPATVVNGGGDSATEVVSGVYQITVAEPLTGRHYLRAKDGDGNLRALWITETLADDTGTYRCSDWIDVAAISGDATAADNLESYCDGTTPIPANATQISGDATAADNLESYCDGTTPIPANATQISGDATAADNLESYCDGTTPQPVNATQISGSATAADNAEIVFATDFASNYDATNDRWLVDAVTISGSAAAADNVEAVFTGAGDTADVDFTVRRLVVNNDTTEPALNVSNSAGGAASFITTAGTGVYALQLLGAGSGDYGLNIVADDTPALRVATTSGASAFQIVGGTSPIDYDGTELIAAINATVDTALADIHLDHLLAADYDPASKPGTPTALLNELVESDGGVSRFTANALEQGPSGSLTAAAIADAVWDELADDHTTDGTFGKAFGGATNVYVAGLAGTLNTLDALDTAQDSQHATTQTAVQNVADAVSAIAASTTALVTTATDDNGGGTDPLNGVSFVGSVGAGTRADLEVEDGAYLQIDDASNAITFVVEYEVPANSVPLAVEFDGYLTGSNDAIELDVYDNDATAWVTKSTLQGTNGTSNTSLSLPLGDAKFANSSNKVYVRFTCTGQSNPTLYIDRLVVTYQSTTVGYSGGYIYFDSSAGNTNTTRGIDGTADNPVSSWAAVVALQSATGLTSLDVKGTLTPTSTLETFATIYGHRATLDCTTAVNAGDVEIINFKDVTGTITTSGARPVFRNCQIASTAALTIVPSNFQMCELGSAGNNITASASGAWDIDHCSSGVAGTGRPTFDFDSTDNNTVGLTDYSRGITLAGLAANDVVTAHGRFSTLELTGAAGTVSVQGQYGTLTNSLTDPTGVTVGGAIPTLGAAGYEGGSVYVDEVAGTSAGTVVGEDATFRKQSDDFDNAQDVADAIGSQLITIRPGNSITLTDSLQGYTINNVQATINGGSQNVDSTRINGGFLTGTFARDGTGVPTFSNCNLNNVTSDRVACLNNCGILGTFTIAEAGVYVFNDAQAAGSTSLATLDFGSLAATASFQRWSGDLTVNNLAAGATLRLHMTAGGAITLNGADATVILTGVCGSITNNLTGSPDYTNRAIELDNINEEVDTALTALNDFDPSSETVDVGAIDGSTTAATNLKNQILAAPAGLVATAAGDANTATAFDTDLPTENTGYYGDADGGLVLVMLSGETHQYQTARVVNSVTVGSNTRLTLEKALDGIPADGDAFFLLGRITELV